MSVAPPAFQSPTSPAGAGEVKLLSSTGWLLAAVVERPNATLHDLARSCNKTERTIWQGLRELERAGLLRRERRGRRNCYRIDVLAVARQLRAEGNALLTLVPHSLRRDGNGHEAVTAPFVSAANAG